MLKLYLIVWAGCAVYLIYAVMYKDTEGHFRKPYPIIVGALGCAVLALGWPAALFWTVVEKLSILFKK